MKNPLYIPLLLLLVGCSANLKIDRTQMNPEETVIRELLINGYINGAFNEMNVSALRKAFHTDFAMLIPQGDNITRYTLLQWVEAIEKRKSGGTFGPSKKMSPVFKHIGITGNTAQVQMALYRQENLIYTDFLHLIKLESGWKVISKIFYDHTAIQN